MDYWEFTNEKINGFRVIKNNANNRIGYYIDHGPLVGIEHYGIIDYGTNVIVVRPNTGCLLDCVYCYVSESRREKKDFLVDKNLLIEWFRIVKKYKEGEVEAHIDGEGDILLYPWLEELIKKLSKMARVSIDTHGYLMNKEKIDMLIDAGVERINIVLNTLEQEKVKTLYGKEFNLKEFLENIKYAAKKTNITIAPILAPGYNYDELRSIIKWVQENIPRKKYPRIAPQNYMVYRYGKKPVRPMPFPGFIQLLRQLEEEMQERLWLDFKEEFNIHRDGKIPRVFNKNEEIIGEILLPGRWPSERIATARNRLILVRGSRLRPGRKTHIRITHAYHTYEGIVV